MRVLAVAVAVLVMLSATGCNKLMARDQLNKGVSAYKNNQFEQAINYFKKAVSLDPNLKNAKLYLATAYAQQYIPGVDSPGNLQSANLAIEQYQAVYRFVPSPQMAPDPNVLTPPVLYGSPTKVLTSAVSMAIFRIVFAVRSATYRLVPSDQMLAGP